MGLMSLMSLMNVDDVIRFTAVIYLVGQNRCVDIPPEAQVVESDTDEDGGETRVVPVVLTVGGRSVKTNLLPRGEGRYRVFINSKLRKAAVADVGDPVDVEIRLDLADREPEMPVDVEDALRGTGWALELFQSLTVNQRREMVAFVTSARQESTRIRRIARLLEILQDMRG